MYGLEKNLIDQLVFLKEHYGVQGIKAEFEAEGSGYQDLVRLRRLSSVAGIKLFLKIGGPEAVRDIKDSLEIGVDGLIAPMVESAFGAKKFCSAYKKIYGNHRIHLSINVETKAAIDSLDIILEQVKGEIDNITVGRSDLSGSYFDPDIVPDSDFVFDLIDTVSSKAESAGLTTTVGGSINVNTIKLFNNRQPLAAKIERIETRKIIMPTDSMLDKEGSLTNALKFEELYILSKKEFSDNFMNSEMGRLTELQRRQ